MTATLNQYDVGLRVDRIVTRPMGGWKYGKAYAVSRYELCWNCDGTKLIWKFICHLTSKKSLPQLRRMGWINAEFGRPKI